MAVLTHLPSALGIAVILAVAWTVSENRKAFPWRTVAVGIALQAALAVLLLKVTLARNILFALNGAVGALTSATGKGTSFVFGYVGGTTPPFAVTNPNGLVSF